MLWSEKICLKQGNMGFCQALCVCGDELAYVALTLRKISEAWPCCRVMKDIVPPKYIYPIVRYKQWLVDDMKWILRDEKAYMRTSKKARRIE